MDRALITGGGGFVGKAIIHQLLKKEIDCTAIGRSRYPELKEVGVKCIQGDISDRSFMFKHLQSFDTVFHVAALAGIWGSWDTYYRTNVLGTQNIIAACLENRVKTLVYTSTPSVVFNSADIINGDESLPYPQNFLCNYARSKVTAEKEVLSVNQHELKTCAIRPHLIWGPGDPHLIPRLIERGKKRQLKIVGDGENLVDLTFIDNVAHAHILAASNLNTTATAAANAYFISQERPVKMWEWINTLFDQLGIPQVTKKVTLKNARLAGSILETIHKAIFPHKEPKMTRFLAEQLAKSHCFSHKKAETDLGYRPIVSLEEGQDKLLRWLKS